MILEQYILFCCYLSLGFAWKKNVALWEILHSSDCEELRSRRQIFGIAEPLISRYQIFVNRRFPLAIRLVSNMANGMLEKSEACMISCCDADFSCESCTGVIHQIFALGYLDYTREVLMYLHTQLHIRDGNVCFFSLRLPSVKLAEMKLFVCSLYRQK